MASVKLYTAPMCSRCIRVKEFLNFIDVEYEEVNIEEEENRGQEVKDLTGSAETPVLAVGEQTVQGFDREMIVEALQDNGVEVDRSPTRR